ncbi:MAG: fibronectin type III domain-containing protein, partial [Promethearchaeia archaeon]
MERIIKSTKRRQLVFFLIGIFVLQGFVFALIFLGDPTLNVNDTNGNNLEEDNTEDTIDEIKEKELKMSSGINPNLTRTETAPLILDNKSTGGAFDGDGFLHGLHRDNIRIAYYSANNEWVTVPYQLDEKAFFRTYTTGLGMQADISANIWGGCGEVNDIDLSNMIFYDYKHGYAGKHIDGYKTNLTSPSASQWEYEEPTEWATNMSVYEARKYETKNDQGAMIDDLTELKPDPRNFPGSKDETATQEAPGMKKEQLEHRIDWDDELTFYAYNGKRASEHSWWNHEEYPNRYRVKINDPVDGGQSWMYIYYNKENMENPPTGDDANYYIPSSGPHKNEDHVSWDGKTKKITADTYEEQLDTSNTDLSDSVKIKWPGIGESETLIESMNKQYVSTYFQVYYENSDLCDPVNEDGDTEVWREGWWERDDTVYDEQKNAIGYGLTCDFDLSGNGMPTSFPGQDTDDTNAHRTNDDISGVSQEHTTDDSGEYVDFAGQATNPDAADHDGDEGEMTPYLRGKMHFGEEDNKSAIDGPIRVVLDKLSLQTIFADLDEGKIGYEEVYTVLRDELKYYSSFFQTDPTALDIDLMGESSDFEVNIDLYYDYMMGREFSDAVRNDETAEIWMGVSPDNYTYGDTTFRRVPGSTEFPNWAPDNHLTLYPDGDGTNDDYVSDGGPIEGTYGDTTPNSDPNTNPLPNWFYLSTSYGGAWMNIPYWDIYPLFSESEDMSTYWRDESGFTDMSFYGHDSNTNGKTNDYQYRTVFGNYSHEDCMLQFARNKYQLNDQLEITREENPGGPIFEDSKIYINGDDPGGLPYVKNGDRVDIWLDVDGDYATSTFSVDTDGLTSSEPTVEQIDSTNYIYNVSFVIDSKNATDRVPPSSGYIVNTTIEPEGLPLGYHEEEFYLDNTDPTAPTVNASQPSLDEASAEVTWSGAEDNGREDLIDHYEVYRNGSRVQTINDYSTTSWLDTNVIAGNHYRYYVKVFDKVGHSNTSNVDSVYIDLEFNPAQPDALPDYFTPTVTLNWTDNPGDTDVITNYRAYWSESESSGYTAFTDWLGSDARSAVFDPQAEDSTPKSGTEYYFKIRCAGPVDIYSAPVSSIYDNSDPFAATINDLSDPYAPDAAEIPIEWDGAFDSLSGIGHYELFKRIDSGTWNQIPSSDYEFDSSETSYTDTEDLSNGSTYEYYVSVYDAVGNGPVDSSIMSFTYDDSNVNPEANLWIDSVSASEVSANRTEPFDVNVTIKNTGGASGTVDTVSIDFSWEGSDMTSHFSPVSDSTGWTVTSSGSKTVTISDVKADASTPQGEMLIDAEIIGDNNDTEADSKDTIWIRDFSDLTISDTYADSPVERDSTNNRVSMNVTNSMITTTEITGYKIDINGLTKGTDYAVNNPDVIGTQLSEGETIELEFIVSIYADCPQGTFDIDYTINGTEVPTGLDVSNFADNAQNITIGTTDSDPPTFGTVSVDPTTGDPDTGDNITISVDVTDESGVAWVTADLKDPDGIVQDTVNLYDDGTHGDETAEDDTWTTQWNCSGALEGTYSINFTAEDTVGNVGELTEPDAFTIKDETAPTIENTQVSADLLELGDIQNITTEVSDSSGIESVTAFVQDEAEESTVATLTMYDDGSHGDKTADDGTYTCQWDSTGDTLQDYVVDIRARDASSETNEQYNNNSASFTLQDMTGPTLSAPNIDPDEGEIGQIFTITSDVTDLSGIQNVTAYIQTGSDDTPPTAYATLTMYDDGTHGDVTAEDDTYTCQWDSSDEDLGTYYVDIRAVDDSGSDNTEEVYDIDNNISVTDLTDPSVSNVNVDPASGDSSPPEGTVFNISAQVTDNTEVDEVWADLELDDNNQSVQLTDTNSDDVYDGTWNSTGADLGTYTVYIRANDTVNNVNYYQSEVTFDLEDNTAPQITDLNIDYDPLELGHNLTINVTVTDYYNVSWVRAYLEDGTAITDFQLYDDGTHEDETAGDNIYTNTWNSSTYDESTVNISIQAQDENANEAFEDNMGQFDIIDTTAPTISNVTVDPTSGDPTSPGQVFTITAEVNDISGINWVRAYLENGTNSIADFQLYDDGTHEDETAGDNIYTNTWNSSGTQEMTINVDIEAQDTADTPNNASAEDQDTIDLVDETAPTIQNVDVSPNAGPMETNFTITAEISDLSGILEAYATIENGTFIESIVLVDDGTGVDSTPDDGVFSGKWDSTGFYNGTYNVDINATDDSTAQNVNSMDNVTEIEIYVADETAPTIKDVEVNPDFANTGTTVNISALITDASGIYTPNITITNGSWSQTYDLVDSEGNDIWTYDWDTSGRADGMYNISFNATDKSENHNVRYLEDYKNVNLTNAPIISDVQVADATLEFGEIQNITCNVFDNDGVQTVTAYIESPDETVIDTLTMYDDGTNGDAVADDNIWTTQWNSTDQSLDTYYIDIEAEDTNSNTNTVDNGAEFIVQDTEGPSLTDASISPDSGDLGTVFNISVTATDLSGVKNVTAIISSPDEADNFTVNLTDPDNDDIYTGEWNSTGQPEGTYTVDILSYDTLGNSREIENIDNDITISDQTDPEIGKVVASPNTGDPEAGTVITITAEVSDLSGISSVTADVQNPNETTIESLSLYDNNEDGNYTNTWDCSGQSESWDNYYIDITAIDDSSNQNEQFKNNSETFQLRDTTEPQISNIQVSEAPLELGDIQLITCDVSDYSGILNVSATLESGSYSKIISLVDDGNGEYSGQWNSTGHSEGNYTIDIEATDDSIAQNVKTIINGTQFTLEDTKVPSVTNVQVSPSTADPTGDIVNITAEISDVSGIQSAYATIENGTWSTTLTLVDNGTNGDVTAGDGTYTCQWNSTGYSEDTYNIDVNATDDSIAQNERFRDNVASVTLSDSTPPTIENTQVSDAPLELGDIQTISCDVTDISGIYKVTALLQNATTEDTIDTLTMDDNGDGNYTGQWESEGYTLGEYVIDIKAIDDSNSENEQYENNVASFALNDTTAPTISSVNADPNEDVEIGVTNITISAQVSDFSEISEVWATIQNSSTSEWMASLQLVNTGGNNYAGEWNSTGFNPGNYSLRINATDNAEPQNTNSSDWSQNIELVNPTPDVSLATFDATDGNVILNSTKGGSGSYFAGDNVTFVFGIQVNKTDIHIRDIYIDEFSVGDNNYDYLFTDRSTNLTLPYELTQGDAYTYVELTYSIDENTTFTDDIEPGHLIIEYEDQDGYKYPPLESERTFISIDLYEQPDISNVEIDTEEYVQYPNSIEFRVTATHQSGDYNAYLNLTAWNNTEGRGWDDEEYSSNSTIYKMEWDSDYYTLEIDNFRSGDYYGNEINVIFNTSITGITNNKTLTTNFTDDFTVDGNAPIIGDEIQITTDEAGNELLTELDPDSIDQFYVFANITDDPIGTTGIDDENTKIIIEGEEFLFDNDLDDGIRYATIEISHIDSSALNLKEDNDEIRFNYIYAYDRAGNEVLMDVRNYSMDLI